MPTPNSSSARTGPCGAFAPCWRVIRDITRKIRGDEALESVFARPLSLARRVKDQRQCERGRKVYSLHAPEVECIGKGKAHRPYEFGVKVSVATPLNRCRGGQFVAHVKALPGNPYDGHTLAAVLPDIENTIGARLERIVTDAGYKGHNAPKHLSLGVEFSLIMGAENSLVGAFPEFRGARRNSGLFHLRPPCRPMRCRTGATVVQLGELMMILDLHRQRRSHVARGVIRRPS